MRRSHGLSNRCQSGGASAEGDGRRVGRSLPASRDRVGGEKRREQSPTLAAHAGAITAAPAGRPIDAQRNRLSTRDALYWLRERRGPSTLPPSHLDHLRGVEPHIMVVRLIESCARGQGVAERHALRLGPMLSFSDPYHGVGPGRPRADQCTSI